jgi:hypothetical protein
MSTIHTFTSTESWPDILTNLNTNFDNINDDLVQAEADIVTLQGQIPIADASTTVKWPTKLSVAPASASNPIAVGDNDPRVPTQWENDALAGTFGTPSSTNKFVTETDPQFTGIVKTTTDQTIWGVKTFSSIPVLPASDPTTGNQAVRKSYADWLVSVTTTNSGNLYYSKRGKLYFGFTYYGILASGTRYWMIRSDATTRAQIATILWITIASYIERDTVSFDSWWNGDYIYYTWSVWDDEVNVSSATVLHWIVST